MKQPKLSLRFACPGRPAWNGDVVYRTEGRLARAARSVRDMVPAPILGHLTVTARGPEGDPMPLDSWLARL